MQGMAFRTKLRMSLSGLVGVMRRPRYIFAALVLAFLFALIIYLLINLGSYGSLLGSSLPFLSKLKVVFLMIQRVLQDALTTLNGALLVIVSLLQGVSLAMLVFTVKHNKSFNAKTMGGSGAATVMAAVGLGCVPCGTSVVVPVLSIFFSSSAYVMLDTANMIVLLLAFGLSVYSIHKLGFVASAYLSIDDSKHEIKNKEENSAREDKES